MPLTFEAVPGGMMGSITASLAQAGKLRGGRTPKECSLSVYSYALGKGIICRMF